MSGVSARNGRFQLAIGTAKSLTGGVKAALAKFPVGPLDDWLVAVGNRRHRTVPPAKTREGRAIAPGRDFVVISTSFVTPIRSELHSQERGAIQLKAAQTGN